MISDSTEGPHLRKTRETFTAGSTRISRATLGGFLQNFRISTRSWYLRGWDSYVKLRTRSLLYSRSIRHSFALRWETLTLVWRGFVYSRRGAFWLCAISLTLLCSLYFMLSPSTRTLELLWRKQGIIYLLALYLLWRRYK